MEDFFKEKKPYTKTPLSIESQIEKLEKRGLIIDNKELTNDSLSNISYYRLRAYTYPFQDNTNTDLDHQFLRKGILYKDIIDLYSFDSKLRSLIFNSIEKIEIALRTKIIQRYSESTNNSHWYEDESLFNDKSYFVEKPNDKTGQLEKEEIFLYNKLYDDIIHEINRSNEDFIQHYKSKYSTPDNPPAWMALEVISFGTLSRLYELLKKDDNKKAIAKLLGLNKIDILENWMHALSILRNCCAHHSRIWNRRFIVSISLPTNTDHLFLDRESLTKIKKNKIFAYLCCIKYILNIINPNNDFHEQLKNLIENESKLVSLKDLGFPVNWNYLEVWK